MRSIGFLDKLYWREVGSIGIRHCFKKSTGRRYVPLCGLGVTLSRIGGQAIERPPVHDRCGRCDGLEMERRGWHESGRATVT